MKKHPEHVLWLEQTQRQDVSRVGGKNASLGEMLNVLTTKGIRVPEGFATTADAYWQFLDSNGLRSIISKALADKESGVQSLSETGKEIRQAILNGKWPESIAADITEFYSTMSAGAGTNNIGVAVRSSATAEDLPDASFAGQQETYLNIEGRDALLDACKRCYASLFTDRAISYREAQGFDHMQVALSVGVQVMVRSDIGGSGVMFSIDTETGFDEAVIINAACGLGENVVQGTVDPDEYIVFKPLLNQNNLVPIIEKQLGNKAKKMVYATGQSPVRNVPTSESERNSFVLQDAEILTLARWACLIEQHYGSAMDIEWAKDGDTDELFIVQARPETVQSRRDTSSLRTFHMKSKGQLLVQGLSIGDAVVSGPVCLIDSPEHIDQFVDGSILVTSTTDPDWVPIMKRARGIITDHGGRTSHAAIVSRELGVPAVVGCGDATTNLHMRQEVTISCAEGDKGFIYAGKAEYEEKILSLDDIPSTLTQVMLNLADPGAAFRWWQIPSDGVGLARMEFVVGNHIRIHPMALVNFDALEDTKAKELIAEITVGYSDKTEYFVDKLARGLSRIAATVYPKPVIVRTSDFKTNEYANLIGGSAFEPTEDNPMIGFRGASRYYSAAYCDGFALECKALQRLRDEMGFSNVIVMIPFCRSIKEADEVLEVIAKYGLKRGENDLQVYVMCEVPSNVILAEQFAERFDGFSIGSNDLTQLTLGVDRDSDVLSAQFDEQDDAVKWMIRRVIRKAHQSGTKVGLCGQAPSDHPEFAQFLVECGIDSISVTPDSFIAVKEHVADAEKMRENLVKGTVAETEVSG